tara:strand:- start:15180 stop:15485 length:306 start_codon:yes stop_codon:yes gene_type:complete
VHGGRAQLCSVAGIGAWSRNALIGKFGPWIRSIDVAETALFVITGTSQIAEERILATAASSECGGHQDQGEVAQKGSREVHRAYLEMFMQAFGKVYVAGLA